MFRCCLPCRGGSKAPATSSPDSENSTTEPFYPCDSIVHDGQQPKIYLANSKTKHFTDAQDPLDIIISEEEHIQQSSQQQSQQQQQQQQQHQQQQQQLPLPHIEEEEETPQTSPEDEVSKKKPP